MTLSEFLMCLELGLVYGIVSVGIYLTFRTIDFPDLGCDGTFVLGAVTSAVLIDKGFDPSFSLICAIFTGSIAGLVTGLLNVVFKITDLLCGILVAFMLYSINLKIMGGIPNIALIGRETIFTNHSAVSLLLFLTILIVLGIAYVLTTDFGLALRSIGQNKRLGMNVGVKIGSMTIIGLALSNALIALGGALFSQHQGFVDISQGFGTIIIGLAAVMIGEKILPTKSLFLIIFSSFLGSVLYRVFIAVALHSERIGIETQDLNLITGLMVIAVMLIPKAGKKS